jgi:hypothetical protein
MAAEISKHNRNKRRVSWSKDTNLLVTIISIVLSTLVGILSIVNSNSIAHIDKDFYVPRLKYQITQEKTGYINIEVSNQGAALASGVSININWKPQIQLDECSAQPPYQDIQSIQPVVQENLTYRLSDLPINGVFTIVCRIETNPNYAVTFPIPPGVHILHENDFLLPGKTYLLEIFPFDKITVVVLADNMNSAAEKGQFPQFINYYETPTATP